MRGNQVRLIAYYLPQYHPIQENNQWWGNGFTEWVSVAKARPLFKGHYQPLIPEELGFYDLRLSETREHQAQLARDHGLEGFCYWHYWFGNGKMLLERPFNEVLQSGKPDFPFCLGWANHSWKGVFFGAKGNLLIDQQYLGKRDSEDHFNYLLKAFSDSRYIFVDGKPLLHIFNPKLIPDCKNYLEFWRELSVREGLKGIFIVGEGLDLSEKEIYGVDAVTYTSHREIENARLKNRYIRYIYRKIFRIPGSLKVYSYSEAMKYFIKNEICPIDEFPCIIPNWDTTARLGKDAFILHESTPYLFRKHVKNVFETVKHKPYDRNIIFIKSWNEWAEGNYLEPDRRYGRQYLENLRDIILENNE